MFLNTQLIFKDKESCCFFDILKILMLNVLSIVILAIKKEFSGLYKTKTPVLVIFLLWQKYLKRNNLKKDFFLL